MGEVADRIDAVLEARREQLPLVERELARWGVLRTRLADLAAAVEEAAHPGDPEAEAVELGVDVTGLEQVAVRAQAALATTRARVSRHTVNIGVSGRARNGKSTLLQALSGLTDEQIPAGQGQPVTAVRSRILHSAATRAAQLTLHTERSFCADVIAPYFRELGMAPEPRSPEEFERFDLERELKELPVDLVERNRPIIARLREMRQSLPSYRHLLTGELRQVEMAELRSWVAYPPPRDAGVPDRRYLAVRDAVITCAFPIGEVAELGLIDLPGLGELVPNAEQHHLAGLENDVDFVIVVKRPTETNAMWAVEDQKGLDLIGQACGAAAVRDFMTILINTGGCSDIAIDALSRDIRDRLNEGADERHYQVWQADVADRGEVEHAVLGRALTHLAAALPRMDAAVVDQALGTCEQARQELLAQLGQLQAALRAVARPTAKEEIAARAKALRDELLDGLGGWIGELRGRVGDTYEDEEFLGHVERLREEIRGWAMNGFDAGRTEWVRRAQLDMGHADGAAKVATDRLNAIRNELARRLSGIDEVLAARREEFWGGLLAALGPRFARLAHGPSAQAALVNLERALREAADPCPDLAEAVDVVLDVRLDYRTRLLPQMRRKLDLLRPESVDPKTGEVRPPVVVPRTAEGAEQLYGILTELTRQVIYEAGQLLEEETQTMALALLAYAEQFEDMVIRSESTEAEFVRLVEAYRDELWPDERSGPTTATARVQRIVRLVRAVSDDLRSGSAA